jgi:hypothetical protein
MDLREKLELKYRRVDIYDLIETLTVEERKDLIRYLEDSIREMEEKAPGLTYLEEQWQEIRRLLKELEYEPYIDDQWQIWEIWDICEELIKSGRIRESSWEIRKEILSEIIEGEFFDWYGVIDPMQDLFRASCLNGEEKISCADMVFREGSDYMKKEVAPWYLEGGRPDKYYTYLETFLGRESGPYEELIGYYWDKDREKAITLADTAMKKCRSGMTGIMVFLLRDAAEKGDTERYAKLTRSAKTRVSIDYAEVLRRLGQEASE